MTEGEEQKRGVQTSLKICYLLNTGCVSQTGELAQKPSLIYKAYGIKGQ